MQLVARARMHLGFQLRRLRLTTGRTLAEVAELAGCSKGHLSKVESGLAMPSIALLTRLADALGMEPGALLTAAGTPRALSLVRAGERLCLTRDGGERGYGFEAIAHLKADRWVEAYVIELAPEAAGGAPFRHPGQELFYVLEGEVMFTYDGERTLLSPGDCLLFDADRAHRGDAHGGRNARALAVIIPPHRPARGAAAGAQTPTTIREETSDVGEDQTEPIPARRA